MTTPYRIRTREDLVNAPQNPETGYYNLTGADLTSADLTGENLAHTIFTGANLEGASLNGANLE